MENMLPLNFGVRTKGRIKANTLLNPAFWETFSVKYSLRKEIVHHHMGLHCIGVYILLHAVGGDHCYENGLPCSGLTDEGSDLIPEFLIIILVDDVWLGRPLHLADVDGVVPAVDEQVNLSPSLSRSQIFRVGTPGALFGHHSCNAQRGFDLPHMLKTYPLEGQAGPGALHALSKTVITVWECELSKKNRDATIARIEADLRAAKEKYENGPPSAASREYAREQAFKHREVLAPVEAGLNLPKSLRRYAKKALLE